MPFDGNESRRNCPGLNFTEYGGGETHGLAAWQESAGAPYQGRDEVDEPFVDLLLQKGCARMYIQWEMNNKLPLV